MYKCPLLTTSVRRKVEELEVGVDPLLPACRKGEDRVAGCELLRVFEAIGTVYATSPLLCLSWLFLCCLDSLFVAVQATFNLRVL